MWNGIIDLGKDKEAKVVSIKKYKKKPVVIEAMVWDGMSISKAREFCGKDQVDIKGVYPGPFRIRTLEGIMIAEIGDYIIKGVEGECYPCKPDIFHKTYEEVE